MFKKILFVLCILFSFTSNAITIDYALKMPKPQNHYFEVEMKIKKVSGKFLEVKMPVWAPGSYMIREFSKNINLVVAKDELGKKLNVTKVSKNTWRIYVKGKEEVKINYEVYAFELSARSSFLDQSHGFVSGSSIFMYVEGEKETGGKLDIYPHEDFNVITTALPKAKDSIRFENAKTYVFSDFDQLVDCPIEIGNQDVFEFNAAGVKHSVAIYGVGNYEVEKLKIDMKRVIETTSAIIGENPNKNYTFIIHNVTDGQGGLEHMNSTTLSVDRWSYQGKQYIDFLSLVAHEYFHLWNVKRIKPIELGPFNYDQENYTTLLWVMEGFTSYYDELLMRRAGYLSEQEYIQKLNSILNYVEGSEGARVQPVAHASFDAWIKGYRPNENSSNTTMTYYSRGQLMGSLLDAKIIAKFEGNKSLDDFMRALYIKFYKNKGRGFTEEEFEETLSDFMGEDMHTFLINYIYDTKVPNYKEIFNEIGVNVDYIGTKKAYFGMSYSKEGTPFVKTIRSNSEAENAAISVNDEIIGFNGFRIDGPSLEASLGALKTGESFNLIVARDQIIMEIACKMGEIEIPTFKMSINGTSTNASLCTYWLRKTTK
jgi:predicted metalloprotease with PDZ domain